MNPNLVGATGQRFALKQSKLALPILETILYPETGACGVAGWMNSLFKPYLAGSNGSLAQKRLIHLEFHVGRPTPYDCEIAFRQPSFLDQSVKIPRCVMRFSDENQPAGFAV